MTKTLAVILIMSIGFAFKCNSTDTKKTGDITSRQEPVNPFFPLSQGNYWEYINEAPREETELFTAKVQDLKKTEGGIQVKMTSFPYLTKENTEVTLKAKQNGEIEAVDYFNATAVFVPAADNFKKGYEWQYGIFGAKVTSTGETVVTEAGMFNDCYYITMTEGFTFSFEMWYKKDIGIVKWGANRTNPPLYKPVYYVLKEYRLN